MNRPCWFVRCGSKEPHRLLTKVERREKFSLNQMAIRNLLVPKIDRSAWPFALKSAFLGALILGGYGAVLDQFTFTICPEYFTALKFDQFSWADPGFANPRWFVSLIGFIAAGGGGFVSGWILARIAIARESSSLSLRAILKRFWLCPVLAFVFAPIGFLIGRIHTPDSWIHWMKEAGIAEQQAFADVGMIHNFSYIGAISGLVIAALLLRRQCRKSQ